jgi:hypothetical protein
MNEAQMAFWPSERPPKAPQRAPRGRSAFAEAMRDARDIRQWTDGPNPPEGRIRRLAMALLEHGR